MEITHNELNSHIAEMDRIVGKGQPFAKLNKTREIRTVLSRMRESQTEVPSFREVWFYFGQWVKGLFAK